jgi:photosystem II stability/assembly factor-like uncharacterized protein
MKLSTALLALAIMAIGCEQKALVQMKWDKLQTGTDKNITGIFFASDELGWAVTSDGAVLRTADGCKTWQSSQLGDIYFEDVVFADDDNGIAVGSHGSVFRSTDGGSSWADASFDTTFWLYDVAFWDDELGLLVGVKPDAEGVLHGALFATRDGGSSWQEVYIDMIGASSVFIRKPSLAWITCKGSVGSTTDGGDNWEKNILDPKDTVRGAYFVDARYGWIVGHQGLLAFTRDGGWSWQKKGSLTDKNLYGVGFINAFEGVAVGEGGSVFLTTDGGVSWKIDSNFVKSTLRDVQVDERVMWICGDGGTLIKVHD